MMCTAFPVWLSFVMLPLYRMASTIIWTLRLGSPFCDTIKRSFSPIFGPAQHQQHPKAKQEPVKAVQRTDQPGYVAPQGAIVPHGQVQKVAAGQAHAQLYPAGGCSARCWRALPGPPPPPTAGCAAGPTAAKGKGTPRLRQTLSNGWCPARQARWPDTLPRPGQTI